jgi:hypothetical protein
VEWIYYLGDHRSELVEHSPADAERILAVLSRHFASLSTENQVRLRTNPTLFLIGKIKPFGCSYVFYVYVPSTMPTHFVASEF